MRMKQEIKDKYCEYLIKSIEYTSDYQEIENDQPHGDTHPIRFFFRVFENEYGWEIVQNGEFVALQKYLQGLPNCIELPMWYSEQITLAKKFGSIPQDATEKDEQKIIDNFYKFMARLLIKMKNSRGVWY